MFQDGSSGPSRQGRRPRRAPKRSPGFLGPSPELRGDGRRAARRASRRRERGFEAAATSIRVGPVATFFDRRASRRSRGASRPAGDERRLARTLALACFGRFRVLFHSLFRVLFDFPSRYLFAIGLAICVEPRMGRTTRKASGCVLKRPDSRDDEQTGGYGRARCGPGTLGGPHPFGNRLALFHRPASEDSAVVPHATTRRPAPGPVGFSAELVRSRFTRRYSEKPGWFLFLRLVICLSSAGLLVRPQVLFAFLACSSSFSLHDFAACVGRRRRAPDAQCPVRAYVALARVGARPTASQAIHFTVNSHCKSFDSGP